MSVQLEGFSPIDSDTNELEPADENELAVQIEGFSPAPPEGSAPAIPAETDEPEQLAETPQQQSELSIQVSDVVPEEADGLVVIQPDFIADEADDPEQASETPEVNEPSVQVVSVPPETPSSQAQASPNPGAAAQASSGSLVLGEPVDLPEVQSQLSAPAGIPAGFEAFFQEQTTQVDVYYGGLYVTSTLATYDPATMEFLIPDDVVMEIPGISNVVDVREALTGKLPNNSGARCVVANETNCGIIYPDVAGIIFDSSRFRADVFVAEDYLALQAHQIDRFLGPSSAGFSAFQTFSYAFSGTDSNSELQQNLNSRLLLSHGENSLLITGNYSEDMGLELDDLRAQRDWQGLRYEAGFINSYGTAFRFGRRYDILGLSVSSSFDTREDLRFSTGNTLDLYLPLQSTVLLYVDGRLVSSQQLPPGNRQLDTTSLPGGSYDVEMVIRDSSGERTETRFYTKNSQLPPKDENLYSFTLGYLREDAREDPFAVTDTLVWQGGYRARLNDTSAWKVGIAGTSDDLINQVGWFGTSRFFELGVDLAAAMDQRFGLSVDLRAPILGNVFSTNFRRIWNKSEFEGTDGAYLLGPTSTQLSASYSMPFWNGSLNMSARHNERGGEVNEVYSLGYRMRSTNFGTASMTPNFEITKSGLGLSAVITLDFRERSDDWQFNGNIRGRNQSNNGVSENDVLASVGADWRSDDSWQTDLNARVAANYDGTRTNLLASADWLTAYGRARLNSQYSLGQNGDNVLSYGGNYATGVVYSENSLAFGGAQQNRSAVIIDLSDADAENVFFDVIVNGTKRATAIPGRRTIVGVSPYRSHRVSIEPQGAGFVSYSNQVKEVTVYPGNAVLLNWDVTTIDIVFGRLLDSSGTPVAGVLINGVEGLAVSGNQGNFQAELSPQTRTLIGETLTQTCEIEVPRYTARNGIATLGDLVCDLVQK